MVWSMLGPLSTEIAESLALTSFIMSVSQKASLLSGVLLRIVLGFGVDKFGPKKTALISQLIVILALMFTYLQGDSISYNHLLVVALFCRCIFYCSTSLNGSIVPTKVSSSCSCNYYCG